MAPYDHIIDRDKAEGCPAAQPCDHCDLGDLAFCSGLTQGDIRRLSSILGQTHLPAHDTIFREGDPALHLYSVGAGTVKLYKLLSDGRRQITAFMFPGDFFGLPLGGGYAYTAEAVTPVTLCRFPRRKLEGLLEEVPTLEKRLLKLTIAELASAQDQMLLLGRKTAREKVASFLIMLAERCEKRGRTGPSLPLSMSRSDIADYLGLTIETVSRVLTQFKKENIIGLPDLGHVVMRQPELLRQIAEGG
ncbi:cyclic nucleotide-binding domain-containing protein [Telmatospirillum sp. J64-1]|uniref:cyclic nucleotide-binding domain-containing protein n=1 Tax=Telmatospirillum sp. J64-1 TaxID=2502183 RepID=UPI00115DF3F9|nr:cyclic nucleotide-binding domain-containing protein [Telmatospirillum sp. J64-1]